MGFVWIKIFNDFCNIIFSKRDSWKKFICSFKGTGRKFASIFNLRALLSKEIIEDISLLFKIGNIIVIIMNWWNTRYFFVIWNCFQYWPVCLCALTYLRFENKTVLLIFQWWQLGDSVYFEIFDITEYLCCFGNNTSWQNSLSLLTLLFCYWSMGITIITSNRLMWYKVT